MAMEHQFEQPEGRSPVALVTAGAVVGVVAAVWLLSQRKGRSVKSVADSILDICDAAAAKMDEVLRSELAQQRAG